MHSMSKGGFFLTILIGTIAALAARPIAVKYGLPV
jgi:uncharacterized membrane protein YeaQ/YmgE (transglycosylase-associated protein family)